MKVSELIEYLEDYDQDAEVVLGIQPNYPFEHSISRVIERRDFDATNEIEYGRPPGGYRDSFTTNGEVNDVFILEGGQIRYGDSKMWEV